MSTWQVLRQQVTGSLARFDTGMRVEFQAKHLYHDREEVTVHLCKR